MGSGQHPNFNPDGANLIESPSVRAPFVCNDLVAENSLAQSFEISLDLGLCSFILFRHFRQQRFLQIFYQRVAFSLGMFLSIEPVGEIGADFLLQSVVVRLVEFRRCNLALGLAGFLTQCVDGRNDLFNFSVCELDRVHYRFFLNFLRA